MEFKIYQIKDIENCKYAFRSLDKAIQNGFDMNDYELVYEGQVQPKDGDSNYDILEELFRIFNIDHPEDFKGHSLSVSDVVELDGQRFYCDSFGWLRINA